MHTLLFLNPGHFHAALTLRESHPRISEEVYVYAEPGPDLERFLEIVESFNRRNEHPTRWRLHTYTGPDCVDKLTEERRGDIVVIAGHNNTKMAAIHRMHREGFAVLADKPWLTGTAGIGMLRETLAGAPLAMDIMTTRYEASFALQYELCGNPDVFGEFRRPKNGGPKDSAPAIELESVHHLYKIVNGVPLVRPPWYFDIEVQGRGIVDVSSHLVDQAQWLVGRGHPLDPDRDVALVSSRRWPTPVPLELYTRITGDRAFPEPAAPFVRDSVLEFDCNGDIRFDLRGVRVWVRVVWNLEPPPGGADTHRTLLRGTRAEIAIVQGPETGFRDELTVRPVEDAAGVAKALERAIAGWQQRFPGTALVPRGEELKIHIPDPLRIGHEAQFSLVRDEFIGYVDAGEWPPDLAANIVSRYSLIAQAGETAATG